MSTARVKSENEQLVNVLLQIHEDYGVVAVEVFRDIDEAKEALNEAQSELDNAGIQSETLRLEINKLVR